MKSSPEKLRSRGFVSDEDIVKYRYEDSSTLEALTHDPLPWKRTVGIKLLGGAKKAEFLPLFLEILKKEKKLYTRIAVCEVLSEYGERALEYLIPELGKIGGNQHKAPVLVDLKKKSFPLPRDIVARIIIRMDPMILPKIVPVLIKGNRNQVSEAIDILGHMSFQKNEAENEALLFELLEKYKGDRLIEWKIIRAFQAFSSKRVEQLLHHVQASEKNEIFIQEAGRSLLRIAGKIPS